MDTSDVEVRAKGSKTKLFHLQALRGLAASFVVISHSIQGKGFFASHLWVSGYFGVATFFIISGFIIFRTSRDTFGDPRAAAQFLAKRFIRIIPIYWIATTLFIILSPHRDEMTASDIIYSLALVPHYIAFTDGMNPLLGQGWTLHYEVLFYVIFAFGVLMNRRKGLILIVGVLVAQVAYGAIIRPESDAFGPLTLAQYWCRPIIVLFVVGVGLGLLEETATITVKYPFLWITVLLGVWFSYSMLYSESEHMDFPRVLIIWGLCALCVFLSIFGQRDEGKFEVVAEAFGDASYSVYLFHAFILSLLLRLKVQELSPVLYVVAALVGANLLGFVVYTWVERPILGVLRRTFLATPAVKSIL